MKRLTQRFEVFAIVGLTLLSSQSMAVDTATVGSRTNQANVDVLNSKIDSLMAAMQTLVTGMQNCSAQRKFYAPSDPKKDANGCVGVQDYQFTMNDTNGLSTSNGQLNITNSNTANTWGAIVNNTQTGGYGLVAYGVNGHGLEGISTNAYGTVGISTNSWGAYASGAGGLLAAGTSSPGVQGSSTNGTGVYGSSTNNYGVTGSSTNTWSGVFSGKYGSYHYGSGGWAGQFDGGDNTGGVYIANHNNTASLCLNGACRTTWPASSGWAFGGAYVTQHNPNNGSLIGCGGGNPVGYNGGCACPDSSYSEMNFLTGFGFVNTQWDRYYRLHICYK
jgi:hypothetical protein